MSRRTSAIALIIGLAIAVLSVRLSAADDSTLAAVGLQVPGLGFLAAGLALSRRMQDRPDPKLLVLTGLSWMTGNLGSQDHWQWLRGFSQLTYDIPELLLAWLVLALPGGYLRGKVDRAIVAAIAVATCVLAPLQTLLLPPPHDPVRLNLEWLAGPLNSLALASGVLLAALAVCRVGHRFVTSSAAFRHVLGPVLLATISVAVLMIGTSIANGFQHNDTETPTGLSLADPTDIAADLRVLIIVAWLLVALAFFVAITRSRADAGAVGRLLPTLSDDASTDQLQAMLARAVNDPSLSLELEPTGPAAHVEGRRCSDVVFGEHVLARIDHDAALSEHPAALDAVIAALALLLGRRQLIRSLAEAAEQSGVDRTRLESDLLRLRDAFGAFVDPAVAEAAIDVGWEVGGHEVDVTIFFLDVRGFTSWSENATPTQIVDRMNALWDVVVPIVTAHGGHANKFIGDGLLTVFGAPRPLPDHPQRAVAAAQAIVIAVEERFRGDLDLGIGIHTGQVMAGTIGGGGRVEFTVMGDVVNTASRIESATRKTGDTILISEATWTRLGQPNHYEARPAITLKGKSAAVQLRAPRLLDPVLRVSDSATGTLHPSR